MMSPLRTAVIFASVLCTLALEIEPDEVMLLQATVKVVQAQERAKQDAIATTDLVDDADYGLGDPLNCAPKEDAAVEPMASFVQEPATLAPATTRTVLETTEQAETSDPMGTDLVKLVLQLTTLWLVYDGFRKWQREGIKVEAPENDAVAWGNMVKAAQSGDERSFKKCIAHHAVPMHADAWGCTPLHFAAAGGSTAIANELLKLEVEIDALDDVDDTPLHIAARSGHASICELLVKAGANINMVNKQGWTPMVVAGHANQESTCCFLADSGAGAGYLKDEELPPLVVSQVVRKVLAEE